VFGGPLARPFEHVFAGSQQLDHGQRDVGKPLGVGLPALDQKLLQGDRTGLLRQTFAEACGERDDPVPALRRAKHPSNRRRPAALEELRGRGVGRDHEILDQILSPILFLRPEIGQKVASEHRTGFDRLERQRAVRVPKLLHRLRDAILDPELLVHA
jgi:hypothetical protein